MTTKITTSIILVSILGFMSYYNFFEAIPENFNYYQIDDRNYLAKIPKQNKELPVYIILHGTHANAKKILLYSNADKYQDAIVILPNKKNLLDWDFANLDTDLQFIEAIIKKFPDHQIHLAGYSSGGYLAQIFACTSPIKLSSLRLIATSTPISLENNCPQEQKSVILFQGSKDPFYNFDTRKDPSLFSVNESYNFWLQHSAKVKLFKIENGGHTWPGANTSLRIKTFLGQTNTELDPLISN